MAVYVVHVFTTFAADAARQHVSASAVSSAKNVRFPFLHHPDHLFGHPGFGVPGSDKGVHRSSMATSPFAFDTLDSDTYRYERTLQSRGFSAVAGSDEVGRGPLAGPVVAATVILPPDCSYDEFADSKKLSHKGRLKAFDYLQTIDAAVGIGIVSETRIDQINILQASLLAMKRSCEDLASQGFPPDFILVDGKFEIPLSVPQQALIKGESKSSSIAAASIAAKITRDALMDKLHEEFPVYNFAQHKGYPTKAHKEAIRIHGPCEFHRKTFRGVKEFVKKTC